MQEGVQVLKPPTRCFSEFPEWVDRNADLLEGKRVLMYCTGGVRCERASAYVRQKGPAFQDVLQLRGVRLKMRLVCRCQRRIGVVGML